MSRGSRPGERRGGRKKGTPNRITQDVKQVFEEVAQALGGAARLLVWAQSDPLNERIFWSQIYPKLLPRSLKAEHSGPNGQPLNGGVLVVPATLSVEAWEQAVQAQTSSLQAEPSCD